MLRPLPAILEAGHGHNPSIGEGQLQRWSGASLKRIGELEIGHQRVMQYAADMRLHRNVPGRVAAGQQLSPRTCCWTRVARKSARSFFLPLRPMNGYRTRENPSHWNGSTKSHIDILEGRMKKLTWEQSTSSIMRTIAGICQEIGAVATCRRLRFPK